MNDFEKSDIRCTRSKMAHSGCGRLKQARKCKISYEPPINKNKDMSHSSNFTTAAVPVEYSSEDDVSGENDVYFILSECRSDCYDSTTKDCPRIESVPSGRSATKDCGSIDSVSSERSANKDCPRIEFVPSGRSATKDCPWVETVPSEKSTTKDCPRIESVPSGRSAAKDCPRIEYVPSGRSATKDCASIDSVSSKRSANKDGPRIEFVPSVRSATKNCPRVETVPSEKSATKDCPRIDTGESLLKEHASKNDIPAHLQDVGLSFSMMRYCKSDSYISQSDNVHDTDVVVKLIPVYEPTYSALQSVYEPINEHKSHQVDEPGSDIIQTVISQSDSKLLSTPTDVKYETRYPQLLAISTNQIEVLPDHDMSPHPKEVTNCNVLDLDDLASSCRQVIHGPVMEKHFLADQKNVGRRKGHNSRTETAMQNERKFQTEAKVHRMTMKDFVEQVADHFRGTILPGACCVSEKSLSDVSLVPQGTSPKPASSACSYQVKPDPEGQEYMSRLLSLSCNKSVKTVNNDNHISVINKNSLGSNNIKHPINGLAFHDIEMCHGDMRSTGNKAKAVKKEHESMKVTTKERSDTQQLQRVDEEKKTKQNKAMFRNKESHDKSNTTFEDIEKRTFKEMSTGHRSKVDGRADGKLLVECETESHNRIHQLKMVHICRKKANILLQQVQSIINGAEFHIKIPKEQQEMQKKASLKTGETSNKDRRKSKSQSRTRPINACATLPSRSESPMIWTFRDNKRTKHSAASKSIASKVEGKIKKWKKGDLELFLQTPMDARDKHKKHVLDGLRHYLRSQLSPSKNIPQNRLEKDNCYFPELNLTGKCQHDRTRHFEISDQSSSRKYQPLIERHLRSGFKPENANPGFFRSCEYTAEVNDRSKHIYPTLQSSPGRESSKCKYAERTHPPACACVRSKSHIDYYQHGCRTSESFESFYTYSNSSPPRYQPCTDLCANDVNHPLMKGNRQSSAQCSSGSLSCFLDHTETKSECHRNFETRHKKKEKSFKRNSLREALQSARESISAATRVVEALSLVAKANSSTSSSSTSVIANHDTNPSLTGGNSVNKLSFTPVDNETLMHSSLRQCTPQKTVTNNVQRIDHQPCRLSNKNLAPRHQERQQQFNQPQTDFSEAGDSSHFPRQVCNGQIQRRIDEKIQGMNNAISREVLLLTNRSPQAYNNSPEMRKHVHEDHVAGTVVNQTSVASNSPRVARRPKIMVEIAFIKSPKMNQNTTTSCIAHNILHDNERARNITVKSGHPQINYRPTKAIFYKDQTSELTPTKEEWAQLPSNSFTGAVNRCLDKHSPISDHTQDYQFLNNWADRPRSADRENSSAVTIPRYNASLNKPEQKHSGSSVYQSPPEYEKNRLQKKVRTDANKEIYISRVSPEQLLDKHQSDSFEQHRSDLPSELMLDHHKVHLSKRGECNRFTFDERFSESSIDMSSVLSEELHC